MSIPHMVEGRSIAEAWERSLLACYHSGTIVKTQYDVDPNTGVVHPPSRDCMMMMVVEEPLSEPRLHVCLIGGPAELGDYRAELVDGIRDHWVKRRPGDKTWSYTYSGLLTGYGDRLNYSAPKAIFEVGQDDPDNPWVGLALVRDIINEDGTKGKVYLDLAPVDQVQMMIDSLAESPFTRRAIAGTSFPPSDLKIDDPPCLRYIWCRGYQTGPDNGIAIDMHTHWRSRDGYKAALFNMFGVTELLRKIVKGVQRKMEDDQKRLLAGSCPVCGNSPINRESAEVWYTDIARASCDGCGSRPFSVTAGRYVDVSDSYHIYGQDIENFEQGFLTAVEQRPEGQRWWDLEARFMTDMIDEGASRARGMVRFRDERDGITDGHRPKDAPDFSVPTTAPRAERKEEEEHEQETHLGQEGQDES